MRLVLAWSCLVLSCLPLVAQAHSPICLPTRQQLENRKSSVSSSNFPKPTTPDHMPQLPAVGAPPYCDPLFGFPVVRIDNPNLVTGNGVHTGPQVTMQDAYANPAVGFNADGSKLQLESVAGANGIYSIDKATLKVSHAEAFYAYPTWDGIEAPPEDGSDGGLGAYATNGLGYGLLGAGVWHPTNPNKMITLRGLFLYSVDLTSTMPSQNKAHPAVPIADLRSLFDWNQKTLPGQAGCPSASRCFHQRYPTLEDVSLVQCYSSSDLKTWVCTTYLGYLNHLGAKGYPLSKTACDTPGACMATNYVVFRLHSLEPPVDPSRQARAHAAKTNWEIVKLVVNGIDTPRPDVFRTIQMRDSSTNTTAALSLKNKYNGGYKVSISPDGRFVYLSGATPVGHPTLNPIPFVQDLTRPISHGNEGATFAVMNNIAGHAAVGNGEMISMDYETPMGIRKWDLAALTYNDVNPAVNIGVPFSVMPLGIQLSDYLALPSKDNALVGYAGPPEVGNPAYANEIRMVSTDPINGSRQVTRVAYLNGAIPAGWAGKIDLRQPMVSPAGDMIAFSTNYGNTAVQPFSDRAGASYVMVVRVK